ncbi:hypothetical protein E2C01_098825 [Portunus trituberculatus]|uniref:Uncharacterized protein n=1 Tax=Portunus trituberculatus TaxID=210409 RepID=A0A5B7K7Y4_PORTR|nr:hypothetical protein [Portunus trituberculatus]
MTTAIYKQQSGRDSNVSLLRVATLKRGRTQNTGNAAKPATLPLEQQARCSTPSRPNQQQNNHSKGGHNSQTETGEHPKQPSDTCLHPVPETKSAHVYLR